jgi:uncharacterized membrane protein
MKENGQIKGEALAMFKSNYWLCVVASLLAMIVMNGFISFTVRHSENWKSTFSLLGLILSGPMTVGVYWFYLNLWRGRTADIGEMFAKGFTENLGRHIGAYLLTVLYTVLWMILLVVPGIVKALSYSMTPFILADRPELTASQAIAESQRMMMGHKGRLFYMFLSYLGWIILSGLTGGILFVFYVGPWIHSALTVFYEDLREADSLNQGYRQY